MAGPWPAIQLTFCYYRWAWQNPSLTRHIAPEMRITQAKTTTRISPRTGKVRKRTTRPRMSLTDRIANLHLLLQSSSFKRWPLSLTFFNDDVYRVWHKWNQHHPGTHEIPAALEQSSQAAAGESLPQPSGIQALDVTYAKFRPHVEKVRGIFSTDSSQHCSICQRRIAPDGAGALVCSHEACTSVSHLHCLSAAFLDEAKDEGAFVPTRGHCPRCQSELHWLDLVRELSLRMRGERELKSLLKPKRGQNRNTANVPQSAQVLSSEGEDDEDLTSDDECEWRAVSGYVDEKESKWDTRSAAEPSYSASVFKQPSVSRSMSERVIDDSDWDDAEIIT